MEYADREVLFNPNTAKFHESESCAGKQPYQCTFEEAVKAKKKPCSNCVDDELFNYCLSLMA